MSDIRPALNHRHQEKGAPMIFNALREIANTWLREIKPLVDAATLLHFPVTPHEILPREQDLETMSNISINFRLPHLITAIEDNASCVLLIDPKPGLMGIHEPRMFIECVPLAGDEANYNDTPGDRAALQSLKSPSNNGVYNVSAGTIRSPAQRAGSWLAEGRVLWIVTGTVTEQHATSVDFNKLPEPLIAAMTNAALRNAMTAVEEIILLRRQETVAGRQ
jgi:hypothetical protein